MVSQPIRTHIVLECDGSGNMLCVFSDSVDRLKSFKMGFRGSKLTQFTGYQF